MPHQIVFLFQAGGRGGRAGGVCAQAGAEDGRRGGQAAQPPAHAPLPREGAVGRDQNTIESAVQTSKGILFPPTWTFDSTKES